MREDFEMVDCVMKIEMHSLCVFQDANIMQTTISVLHHMHRSIPLKMADNSRSAAKMARILAIVQIITGGLMLGFGIADRIVAWTWTGYVYFGIWIGIWVSVSRI